MKRQGLSQYVSQDEDVEDLFGDTEVNEIVAKKQKRARQWKSKLLKDNKRKLEVMEEDLKERQKHFNMTKQTRSNIKDMHPEEAQQ